MTVDESMAFAETAGHWPDEGPCTGYGDNRWRVHVATLATEVTRLRVRWEALVARTDLGEIDADELVEFYMADTQRELAAHHEDNERLMAKIERVEALSERWSEDAGYYTGHSESLDKALLGEP